MGIARPHTKKEGVLIMEDFDWRKMSKLTFPSGINEPEYLRFEQDGTWTASSRDMCCVTTNSCIGYAVAVLNAKLHPINNGDRDHMITSLQNWVKHDNAFLDKYNACHNLQAEVKRVRRGISRMQKEILRPEEIEFPQ